MSSITAKKMWKQVLDSLELTVSPASFQSWLQPLMAREVIEENGRKRLELAAPSSFHKTQVERRYLEEIQNTAQQALGVNTSVDLVVETVTEPRSRIAMGPLFQVEQETINAFDTALHRVGLREDFTFDNFAVSSSNEMAYAAAKAVADNFGQAYNPLFLYGGVGVGKTHLSQAVAIQVLQDSPQTPLIFCMSEEFTNGIIEAIQQKKTPQFRQQYRKVKGLFIDDIQFIAGKTTVQEEFFHTFNAILKAGGQVVMTSDRPPSEITGLEARLKSRFEAGLLVDIGKPDYELRTAITLIKAKQRLLLLTTDTARVIAANIESARQIEGFLTRLATEAQLRQRPIDDALVESLLGKTRLRKDEAPPPLRPLEVIRGVATYYQLPTKQLQGKRRTKQVVRSRHVAMYLLRIDYKLPLTEIGTLFSDRDHTTVMHAVDKITKQLKDEESLRVDVGQVRKTLYT
jgi:chromosomal replication initiator protein